MSVAPENRIDRAVGPRARPRSPRGWAATCSRCRTTWPRCRRPAGRGSPPASAAAEASLKAAASARSAAQRGAERVEAGGQAGARPQLLGGRGPRARPERVPQPDLERVDVQLLREVVHQRLVGDRRLRHAEPAEGARRRAVGVDRAARAQHRPRPRTVPSRARARGWRRSVPRRRRRRCRSRRGRGRRSVAPRRRRRTSPGSARGGASWSRPSTRAAGTPPGRGGRGPGRRSRSAAGARGRACRRTRRRRRWGSTRTRSTGRPRIRASSSRSMYGVCVVANTSTRPSTTRADPGLGLDVGVLHVRRLEGPARRDRGRGELRVHVAQPDEALDQHVAGRPFVEPRRGRVEGGVHAEDRRQRLPRRSAARRPRSRRRSRASPTSASTASPT